MKRKKSLLFACFSFSTVLGVYAQPDLTNAIQSDVIIGGGTIGNTGLAVAPTMDVHAAVFDDGTNYTISWLQGPMGVLLDIDGNTGIDPDVAYHANEDFVLVAYENAGTIFVDEYKFIPSPFDYVLISTTTITNSGSATYPNIDINSSGNGVLSWEDGGDVYVCSFTVGAFTPDPPVQINPGTQPDVILLDDNVNVALTYINPLNGELIIETLDYAPLASGTYSPTNIYNSLPNTWYEYPRIAGSRNECCGISNSDYTVVTQDYNGTADVVYGFFAHGSLSITNGPVTINPDFLGCPNLDPRPTVTYDRDRIHIAWSQDYQANCSVINQTNPNLEDDAIKATFLPHGGMTGLGYEELNFNQSSFAGISKSSIASRYDGFLPVTTMTNFNLGVVYNDPVTVMWKKTGTFLPNFMDETIGSERGDNFSLVSSPVNQTIEVMSASDNAATFQLMDYAGRIVELKTISSDGNMYMIDISHLSGGMYFLNCSSASGDEVLRVLQVTE